MYHNLFRITLFCTAIAIILAACAAPIPTLAPVTTESLTATATEPFTHTACAAGVDLTGKTVSLYQIVHEAEPMLQPLLAGYEDGTAYFNAHGGICGASIEQVYRNNNSGYDPHAIYDDFAARNPKPVLIAIYFSEDAAGLRDQLAADEIPALQGVGGGKVGAYGADGQSPGWVFSINPIYPDQMGSMCDYIAANPDRFPEPVIGYLDFSGPSSQFPHPEAQAYCESLGIGWAGASFFSEDATYIQPHVQNLVDAGANIIYIHARSNAPSLIARTLAEMGLQDKVRLIGSHLVLDPEVVFAGQADLGSDGLPMLDGMIGSMPSRSWAESDHPGIRLITEQADLHLRPLTMRTNSYITAWTMTDLFIETYIQTGNRVGFEHVTGADMKMTLESIVYAPMGGIEQIDYQDGARRSLSTNRVGEMHFLGQDGKTPASANNPPMMITVGDQQFPVPMVLSLTDFQPAPDLRPGGADVPVTMGVAPTTKPPETTATQGMPGAITGQIAFGTNRDGNDEIYVMNGDGSGLINLSNNPASDNAPVWSPDGTQLVFESNRDGNLELYVMNADGSGQINLTNNPTEDLQPAWSHDGKHIAFSSDRDGNHEIYMVNADGSNPTRLTDNSAFDELPDWSPDGTQVAFTTDRDGNIEVYVMQVDGSNPTNLSNNPGEDAFPRWSPDGTHIAWGHNPGDGGEIYVMNADGSKPTRLTDLPGDVGGQRWSLDGTQIIFDSAGDIYVMNADGSNQMRLTDNPAGEGSPMFKP
jgi:ABC-type branched-subunit amino acid transport system substrate-binding protein